MRPFFPFPLPVVAGTFLARPQRFLVDALLQNGVRVTAYCANPGAFQTGLRRGAPVLLWLAPAGSRKRPHTWRAIKHARTWIGTDTHLANRLVEQTLNHKRLSPLPGFQVAKREPRGARGRRVDFLLLKGGDRCYVEVKNAMIAENGCARFPDSRSFRACAHLKELSTLVAAGHRAVLLFLVQRGDVLAVRINHACDAEFTKAYERARNVGVEVLAVKHAVTPRGFGPPIIIPVHD